MKRLRLAKPGMALLAAVLALGISIGGTARAAGDDSQMDAREMLRSARDLYQKKQFFRSARYAFAAAQSGDPQIETEAYSWVTVALMGAGMPQSAAYFFIRTLQGTDRTAIRRALSETEEIVSHIGVDLLRKYLIARTRLDDYDSHNRSAFLYLLGKTELLAGDYSRAAEHLGGVSSSSPLFAYALQQRGAALAILGDNEAAIQDFRECVGRASRMEDDAESKSDQFGDDWVHQNHLKVEDLRARCQAGIARTRYQANQFEQADEAYDQIPKSSFVWTDILFEQAWNAFAQGEYNRSLGKLVTYKSPSLQFVYNSEVDVLRAQSFLALCQYADANDVINEFNSRYTRLGEDVKHFVEGNSDNLEAFFSAGKRALQGPLHTDNGFHRMLNRFVRGPYFQTLVAAEREIAREGMLADHYGAMSPGGQGAGRGFPGFLHRVLEWRAKTARYLGGAFVKNSLVDYHSELISNFEKMAFIKLEMLRRAKENLLNPGRSLGRNRGDHEPVRKSYQYYWSFNGEFWADELGDYVFGLESECDRS